MWKVYRASSVVATEDFAGNPGGLATFEVGI
jgi:hypothetical protein